ncbi:hypothetical protein D3C87_1999650 [compost metagenome]
MINAAIVPARTAKCPLDNHGCNQPMANQINAAIAAEAKIRRGMRVKSGISTCQWPRFTSIANSRAALTQPATISAVAIPAPSNIGNR